MEDGKNREFYHIDAPERYYIQHIYGSVKHTCPLQSKTNTEYRTTPAEIQDPHRFTVKIV